MFVIIQEAVERKLPQLPEVGSRSNYCVYEVPLLSSLKQFLSNRLILDEVVPCVCVIHVYFCALCLLGSTRA